MVDEHSDKLAVIETVQGERAARDEARWTAMADAYLTDSRVRIMWFQGSGAEFVASSRQQYEGGHRVVHAMGPTAVQLEGDRALAVTGCAVNAIRALDDVDLDLEVHLRIRSRLERSDDSRWRIRTLTAIFNRDRISVRNPEHRVVIDAQELATYRESYQWLSYLAAHGGRTPDQDLPGYDRPDLVDPLVRADELWLTGAS